MKNLRVAPANARTNAEPMRECRVWVIADFTVYEHYKADTNRIKAHIYATYAETNAILEKEVGMHLNVVAIEILKASNPRLNFKTRGVSNEFGQFNNFSNDYGRRTDVVRDLNVLWTLNTGEPYGGVAGGPNNKFQHDTGQTLSAFLLAHETGHNFGSPHTHNCYWRGGPIDACNDPEGGTCYTGVKTSNIGTIMSYCPVYGVGGNLTFHPLCIELMKQVTAGGYAAYSNAPSQKPALLFPQNGQTDFYPGVSFFWKSTHQTTQYQVVVSDKADFSTLVADTTLLANSYPFGRTLLRNTTYYWRVRALNPVGAGAWSEASSFKTQSGLSLGRPVLTEVINRQVDENQRLIFSSVPNANEYEISFHRNVGSTQELTGTNAYKSVKTKKTALQVGEALDYGKDGGSYRWRVRAIADTVLGNWSADDNHLNVFQLSNKTTLPNFSTTYTGIPYKIPTSFVLTITMNFSTLDDLRKYRVEVSETSDFKNLVYEKTGEESFLTKPNSTRVHSLLVNGLKTDTRYFYRVTTQSRIDNATRTGEFTTGTEERWGLINAGNTPVLPQNSYLRGVFVDRDNNKWLYGISGIYVLRTDGTTSAYSLETTGGELSNTVNDLAQDSKGRIWAATNDGIALFENGKWTMNRRGIFGVNVGGYIWYNNYYRILSGPDGILYALRYDDHVLRYDGNRWQDITNGNDFEFPRLQSVDSQGTLWLFEREKRKINAYENGQWSEVTIAAVSGQSQAFFYTADNRGKLWFRNGTSTYAISGKTDIQTLEDRISITDVATGRTLSAFLSSYLASVRVTDTYTYFFGTGSLGFLEYDGNRYLWYNYPTVVATSLTAGSEGFRNAFTIDTKGNPLYLESGTSLYQFNRNEFNGFSQKQVGNGCRNSFRVGLATPPPNGTALKVFLSDSTAATFKEIAGTYQDGKIQFATPLSLRGKGYRLRYTLGDWLESRESTPFDLIAPFEKLSIAGANTFCFGTPIPLTTDLAGGRKPYTYEWQRGTDRLADTQPTLNAATEGTYRVTVTDSLGCQQTSAGITLTGKGAREATVTAAGATAVYEPATVLLNANSGTDFAYQWQKNDVVIPVATGAGYEARETGNYSVVIAKEGCTLKSAPVNVKVEKALAVNPTSAFPTQLTLRNDPNPFEKTTEIRVGLPKPSKVTLQLFGGNGSLVGVLHEGTWAAGWHKLYFDSKHLSVGIYQYRLTTEYGSQTQKMVIVR